MSRRAAGTRSPVAALVLGAILLVGILAGVVVAVLTKPGAKASVPTAATTVPAAPDATATTIAPAVPAPANTPPASGPGDAFAPIAGYTFKDAPPSALAELRRGLDEGVASVAKSAPGLSLDPNQMISDISGRLVVRDGQEVGAAFTLVFDDQWAARIPPDQFLAGIAARAGSSERVTVGGHDAVRASASDSDLLLAYQAKTCVIVFTDKGDRATAEQVMTGLLDNLG